MSGGSEGGGNKANNAQKRAIEAQNYNIQAEANRLKSLRAIYAQAQPEVMALLGMSKDGSISQNTIDQILRGELNPQAAASRGQMGAESATIAGLLGRASRGANGTEPLNPLVEQELQRQEDTIRNRLQSQLGPGYEQTSAGIQTLAAYRTEKAGLIDQLNRAGLSDTINQLNAFQGGVAQNRGNTVDAYLKGLTLPQSISYQPIIQGYGQVAGNYGQYNSLQAAAGGGGQGQGIGQLAGTVIGGVAGSFFGPGGTMLGAGLGGMAGGLIGGAVGGGGGGGSSYSPQTSGALGSYFPASYTAQTAAPQFAAPFGSTQINAGGGYTYGMSGWGVP